MTLDALVAEHAPRRRHIGRSSATTSAAIVALTTSFVCRAIDARRLSVEPLRRLGAILGLRALWVKRDDCTGLGIGGNKVRKLEFDSAAAMKEEADCIENTLGRLKDRRRIEARLFMAMASTLPSPGPGCRQASRRQSQRPCESRPVPFAPAVLGVISAASAGVCSGRIAGPRTSNPRSWRRKWLITAVLSGSLSA
jgi:hypothetical protein